jgi:hypothetical protein
MVQPTHSYPRDDMIWAATLLSTPPLMAINAFIKTDSFLKSCRMCSICLYQTAEKAGNSFYKSSKPTKKKQDLTFGRQGGFPDAFPGISYNGLYGMI